VPVYLEEVELTSDLKVGLNRVQALHRDQDASYRPHLVSALGQSTSKADSSIDDQAKASKPGKAWPRVAGAAAVLLTAMLAFGYYYRDTLLLTLALNAPVLYYGEPIEQELGFVTTPDGTGIAYATSGAGPPIVQVVGFGTHLESGWNSALYDSEGVLAMSSHGHLFVRYDGRGFGLSDRDVSDFSLPARVSDLEAVVDELGLERFGLYAVSAGGPVAIAFTAKHPERVTRLVLAGTVASWSWLSDAQRESIERMVALIEVDWENPAVSNLLAANDGQLEGRIQGEQLRRAANGDAVAGFMRAMLQVDAREQARGITVPTLVIQGKTDTQTPMPAALELAALIPGASLEIVEGGHSAGTGTAPVVRRRILDFFEMDL